MLKNRVTYGLVLLGLFLFYIFCNAYVPLVVIVLLLVLTAVSGVLAFISSRKVKVTLEKDRCSSDLKERTVSFCTLIKNTSRLPAPVVCFEMALGDVSENADSLRRVRASAGAGEKKYVWISLNAPYAAYVQAKIRRVKVCDSFGIFSFRVKCDCSAQVLITPSSKGSEHDYFLKTRTASDSDVYSDTQKGDDRSQVFEVREYRDGDDMRRVHWRLSSKLDTLMVKEYSRPLEERCIVLLESPVKAEPEQIKKSADRILAELVALSARLIEREQLFSVYVYSTQSTGFVPVDVRDYADISAALKAYLSEPAANEPMCALRTFTEKMAEAALYYIYDSRMIGDQKLPEGREAFLPIDVSEYTASEV